MQGIELLESLKLVPHDFYAVSPEAGPLTWILQTDKLLLSTLSAEDPIEPDVSASTAASK